MTDLIWYIALVSILEYVAMITGLALFNIPVPMNIFLYSYPLLAFIPFIVVIIINYKFLNRELKDYGISLSVDNRIYALPALAYPFLVICITIPIAYIVGVPVDWSLSFLFELISKWSEILGVPYDEVINSVILQLLLGPVINMFFAFFEEAGWRGYLLTRLEEEFGTKQAIILSSFIWGIWSLYHHFRTRLFYEPIQMTYIFTQSALIGIFLGLLMIKTRSIVIPSLARGAIRTYLGLSNFLFNTMPMRGFPLGLVVSELIITIIIWRIIFQSTE